MDGSESIVSILFGREGWDNLYDEISNFKDRLDLKEGSTAEESVEFGWVLWCSDHKTQLQHRVINLFRHIAYDSCFFFHYLVQFWAVEEEEEGQNRTFLSTARQPFSVGNLTEGLARYRKLCADHVVYVAGEEGRGPVGGVGRAYRNGYPESTPDLRLYSSEEFPMRDEAARSRLRGYLTLPVYELDSDECCGVLELVSGSTIGAHQLSSLDQGMQSAGLRSTHTNFVHISKSRNSMPEKYKQQGEGEIEEALRLAMATVPRLHFAQVWVPCKQCANSICMERACFLNVDAMDLNSCRNVDEDMFVYLQTCEFHNLQLLDPNHCRSRQNLSDLGISESPLAHHAKKARLSRRFAISLQRVGGGKGDERCVVELFLQPSSREGNAWPLRSVIGIIEAMLENFELLGLEHLPEEPAAQPRQLVDMLITDMESFSESSDFTEYVDTLNSYECCLRPSSEDGVQGWVFRMAKTGNDGEGVLVRERVENLMKNMITYEGWGEYWIVQFWAPKMAGDRCFLQALEQPYAVGCLAKGLALLRKKCIGQRYFVDEEAGEDEVGPPGRVFRVGIHETTPDLSLYSTKEFPIKAYAVNCCLQQYSALPVYNNECRDRCVGVLELIGVPISNLKLIKRVLEATTLCSTHIDFSPTFPENENTANQIRSGREQALSEMMEALLQMANIPQLHMAKVWVPNSETCSSLGCTNARCMELALSTTDFSTWEYKLKNQVHWIHVKPGKGMIGTVLDSESKSCFCQNLYEFSIADQPLAHYQRKERLDACFAICLQSSHTGGDFPYVLEFFLYQTHEYLVSFLNFLIPVMNQQLKSFEYASGKRLAEEMVVEVIELSSGDNTTLTFCEQGQPQYPFPIKFKSVSYIHSQEGEDDKPMPCVSDVMQTGKSKSSGRPKETKKARGKTGSHLNFEDLKPHFGRKLEDVAGDLGVGRSTIKRVCRENGNKRWPNNTKNPSLLERERGRNSKKVIVEEEVTMKVTYKGDTIRFKVRLSLGVAKVMEEVASGLNLKMSTFKLKYLDEDNDEILLARDVDFQHCPRITTASGVTCIKLFVQLISE